MAKTIGNPVSWGARTVAEIGQTVQDAVVHVGSTSQVPWRVHALQVQDIFTALRLGWQDMLHFRSDVIVLALIYPAIGLLLTFAAFDLALLPLLFPLAAGFTLLGPVGAIGFYELSRRRENGEDTGWTLIPQQITSLSVGPVVVLGLYLLVLFVLWMISAFNVYMITLGPDMPASTTAFLRDVFTTAGGWAMIVLGMGIGFIFAGLVLWTCSISFAMLVDKPVGLPIAVSTSMRLASKNPLVVALWGLTVAGILALGMVTLFLGLIVALPLLGHATWHFYRLAISYD